ncbi:MAG: DNA methyltransferase [Flavobacterium psychrophilum]|nr:MAG: DNA methyltransferase [Flavobacterium psychrophilum]
MEPFLKWAGGKRWLVSKQTELLPRQEEYNNYLEPFIGGGAVFFHLQPENGVISDLNSDLINAYKIVRDNWRELNYLLTEYNALHSSEFYYNIRASRPEALLDQAARFIYLNRTCWNGLYRVNKKGEFNVPIGTKTKVILESDNFEHISNLLSDIQIENNDFEVTINRAEEGDFLFIDPPYTVKHNLNGFVKYNENIFSWDDQVRLRDSIIRAKDRGAYVLVLNADHSSIKDLYNGLGEMTALNRASVIAGNANARGTYSELAIKCW